MSKQIDYRERQQIDFLLKHHVSIREIARQLKRSASSISSEIKRNGSNHGYFAISAQVSSEKRISKSRKVNAKKDNVIWDYVIDKLRCGWSPQQIAGRLKREQGKTVICHETIYQYIYNYPEKKLAQYLVKNHKKRRKRDSKYNYRRGIANRVSIHDRPEEINDKSQFGHWEIDSVEGKKGTGAVSTALERKTRYYLAQKVPTMDSEDGILAQKKILTSFPKEARLSATFDNGKENYNHEKLRRIGTKTYFCDPYSSWQKGSNENHNGILRRYIPKKTDFTTFSQQELDEIIEEINNRPRKCLDYETSSEAFSRELQLVKERQVFGFG